jgi:hypothetical protein
MDFRWLLHADDRAGLDRWFSESGELFVDVYHPHSGGGSEHFLLRSVSELDRLLETRPCREIELCVYRGTPFPYRGIAGPELAAEALAGLPEGDRYAVASLEAQIAGACEILGDTESKEELEALVAEVAGRLVGIGLHPSDGDRAKPEWILSHAGKVFYVSLRRNRNNWDFQA